MTDRLTPADAGFLYTEDATTPMHVGGVVVLQPAGTFDYNDIVQLIEARLSLVPRFRQKVRYVPGRFARPVWIDDAEFDITYHVRRSALPKPGTDTQLADLVGRLISRPLDRSRPLWELYVVEGLSGGRVALINKTHLSMVDRVGAVDVAAAILDITPEPRPLPNRQVWIPMPAPSDIDLVVDAVTDITTRPSEVVDAVRLAALDVRSTVSELGQLAGGVWQVVHRAVRPAPRSALNVTLSGQRRFVGVAVDLDRIKQIRADHGGTLNDVLIAIVTGALRSFLVSRGEPVSPGTELRAMMPMTVRGAVGEKLDWAPTGADGSTTETASTSVVSYLLDLPVAEANPVMRLHQVSYAMAAHTDSGLGLGADAVMELGRFAPATLHTLGARVGSGIGRRAYNLMITNVPGPQLPLYAAGIPVVAMYPAAPLAKGQALALSLTSYNGQVFFGLVADRDAVADLAEFGIQLQEAVEEFRSVPVNAPAPQRKPAAMRRSAARRPARTHPAESGSPASRAEPGLPAHPAESGSPASRAEPGLPAHPAESGGAAAPKRSRSKPAPRPAPTRPRHAEETDGSST